MVSTKNTEIMPILKSNSELDRAQQSIAEAADRTDNMLDDLDRQIEEFHQKMRMVNQAMLRKIG